MFCNNCGSKLNENEQFCINCGKKVEEIKTGGIIDKIKNYDYKGTATELKEKAADIADKAKNYDYKSKAEEIKENVVNYDYKAEAENIKKGGFKYFWKCYKFVCIAVVVVVLVVLFLFGKNDSDWALRDLDTLNITQAEIIEHEENRDDSGEPRINGVFVNYDDVEFLDYSANLSYVFNNSQDQVSLMYSIKNVEFNDILDDIEDKLGEGELQEDIAPNYVWYEDEYKYNLIDSGGEAVFVVSYATK